MHFDALFGALTDHQPFPWQRALFELFRTGKIPSSCDLPTGLGKTSVIAIWLIALAQRNSLPRRLVYVVNRRTVVDQSTAEAERLRKNLLEHPELEELRAALRGLGVLSEETPLAISTLRGQFADNAEWRLDPSRASVVVGTVDMIGSRLLFSGYGAGFKSRPLHAAFLGQDSLLIHDEAHLEPAFQELIEKVQAEQHRCGDSRRMSILSLSATSRGADAAFGLSAEDHAHPVVRLRLKAKKGIKFHRVDAKDVPERAAASAKEKSGAVLVFLRTVEAVQKCVAALGKSSPVVVLTGTMRGRERDELASRDPSFARFLPKVPEGVTPTEGTVFLVATSAGEVGIDMSADHLVSDVSTFESMAQRLGRLNRYGMGDAEVEVLCEDDLKAPNVANANADADADDEEEDGDSPSEDAYEAARYATFELLKKLPKRDDGRHDASPAALRELPSAARRAAFSPAPVVPFVDDIFFDRWAFTSIREPLAGRPPVADWLHGVAAWEPPTTTIAWRSEVEWSERDLEPEDQSELLSELMADYPLRAHECLKDRTDRVVKHLRKIVERAEGADCRVWLMKDDRASVEHLKDLVQKHERDKVLLNGATLVLPPSIGALTEQGLFNGEASHVETRAYDLGCASTKADEPATREVRVDDEDAPRKMRLVRAVRLGDPESDEPRTWRLYALPRNADDEGSRTSSRELALEKHLTDTERWAQRLTKAVALSSTEAEAVVRAARWHDLGKRRETWQRSIRNGLYPDKVLAKGRVIPAELGHYRHELGSLHDAAREPAFAGLTDEVRDLLLHLVAAHHGRARPHFPMKESLDPEATDEQVRATVNEVPHRFARLQKKYGRWGLAWLESLLRAADYLASDEDLTP